MPPAALRDSNLQVAVISFNNTGDNTIVAAIANKGIRVYRLIMVSDSSTTVIFKNGTTALTGAIPLYAGGAFVLDVSNEPWFISSVGSAFVINQSGTATITGKLDYHQP